MGNAVEQAQELVEKQMEAFKAVNDFFAPYIEVEKRVQSLKSWADDYELSLDYYFDTEPDNSTELNFSFTTGQYEKWGEYQTGYLNISKELLGDPKGYEERAIAKAEKEKLEKAEKDKQTAAERLKSAEQRWKDAQAQYDKLEAGTQ